MCLRLNTSAGATSASITVQRAALFAGVAINVKGTCDRPSEYVERRDDD
mgnify:CR=1 FL=1